MNQKPIAVWLLLCCVIVFAMIVLGGITRLTGSGLSMVEWAPILGILPPVGEAQWGEVFLLYQQYPEYKLKNAGMSLSGFKSIFWFEYAHRLLGRSIGIIFLLPFLYFLFRKKITRMLVPKLITLFVLGGLQGLMGWYMVKSGLIDNPHVSQYRLTAHLMLAVAIYTYMFWVALDLLYPNVNDDVRHINQTLSRLSLVIACIILLTITSGGFVAGTHAGLVYNTFPLMAGRLIPTGLTELSPVWLNIFENLTAIQFNHRVLATLLSLCIPAFWLIGRKTNQEARVRVGFHLLLAILVLQVTLGISTLLLRVPVNLAAAHQANAIVLLTISLFVNHQLRGRD
ncbi:MAG: COX15/CtaA family protein [Granulosicoccus sp.]